MTRFAPTILLLLLAIPLPTRAGSIRYTFSDVHFPNGGIGQMAFDDAALQSGVIDNADLVGFGFPAFGSRDLNPFSFAISTADGMPAVDGAITGSVVRDGTAYHLFVAFGPGSFGPNGDGFYQVTTGNLPGIHGDGFWTASIDRSAVPEPSSAVPMAIGMAIALKLVSRKDAKKTAKTPRRKIKEFLFFLVFFASLRLLCVFA